MEFEATAVTTVQHRGRCRRRFGCSAPKKRVKSTVSSVNFSDLQWPRLQNNSGLCGKCEDWQTEGSAADKWVTQKGFDTEVSTRRTNSDQHFNFPWNQWQEEVTRRPEVISGESQDCKWFVTSSLTEKLRWHSRCTRDGIHQKTCVLKFMIQSEKSGKFRYWIFKRRLSFFLVFVLARVASVFNWSLFWF